MDLAAVAERHARLLVELAQYDNTRAELRDTKVLLATLEDDLQAREADLKELVAKRKSEHRDLEKLQRSSSRRLFVRLAHGGSGLARKLEQEEHEYIEAAQAEHLASQALSSAREAAENLQKKRNELEEQVQKRKEVKAQIDGLFKSAFDGPTPGFPEEDLAEDDVRAAELHNEQIQSDLSREQFTFSHLDRAATCAIQAVTALQNASATASYDTLVVGGLWADMAERDYILRAQSLSAEAQRMLTLARSANSLVKHVPCGRIIEPQWLSVMFDDLFTEYMFRQKVKHAIISARTFRLGVWAERLGSETRLRDLKCSASDASMFLAERRAALAAIRKDILRRIKDGDVGVDGYEAIGHGGVAPPAYEREPEPGTRILASSRTQPSTTEATTASLAPGFTASQALNPSPQPPKYDVPGTPPPLIGTSTSAVAAVATPLSPAPLLSSTSEVSIPETLWTSDRPKSAAEVRSLMWQKLPSASPCPPSPEAKRIAASSRIASEPFYSPAPLFEDENTPAPPPSMPKSPRLRPIPNFGVLGVATPSPMPSPLQRHAEATDAFAPSSSPPPAIPMWRTHSQYAPPAGPPPPKSSSSKSISGPSPSPSPSPSRARQEIGTALGPSSSRMTRPKYAPPPGPPPGVHRASPIPGERSRLFSSSSSARLTPPPPVTPSSILMPQSQYPPRTLIDVFNEDTGAMTPTGSGMSTSTRSSLDHQRRSDVSEISSSLPMTGTGTRFKDVESQGRGSSTGRESIVSSTSSHEGHAGWERTSGSDESAVSRLSSDDLHRQSSSASSLSSPSDDLLYHPHQLRMGKARMNPGPPGVDAPERPASSGASAAKDTDTRPPAFASNNPFRNSAT